MRWVSNSESVRRGEPSVLAIAETLIAMGLSLWIAVHYGTVRHVAIGSCIAPFLLLRTDDSAGLGLRVYFKLRSLWIRRRRLRSWFWVSVLAIPWACMQGLMFIAIRFLATVMAIARKPASVVHAIPRNWRRLTVATDFCVSPQILPLPDDPARSPRELRFFDLGFGLYVWITEWRPLNLVRQTHAQGARFWITLIFAGSFKWLLLLLAGFLAILYRLSLKSTAIIWFPLLWALRAVAPSDQPLRARLGLLEKSDLLRWIVLPLSAGAIVAFGLKLWFWNEAAHAAAAWNESIAGRIATIHIAPGLIERWQLATVLNSAIAIGLWLYVRSCLRHYKEGVPRRETVVELRLAWTLIVRRLLSAYTILCVGYLYALEAWTLQLPPLGGKLFPWM
jgi:hypothetical protein